MNSSSFGNIDPHLSFFSKHEKAYNLFGIIGIYFWINKKEKNWIPQALFINKRKRTGKFTNRTVFCSFIKKMSAACTMRNKTLIG